MNFNFFKSKSICIWANNKPLVLFLLIQIFALSILKIVFYNYNYNILFFEDKKLYAISENLNLINWALKYDAAIVIIVNILFVLCLHLFSKINKFKLSNITVIVFTLINSFILILNIVDIFYYKFHFQRINADVLFVFNNIIHFITNQNILITIISLLFIALVINLYYKLHSFLYKNFKLGNKGNLIFTLIFCSTILILILDKKNITRKLVPTYPLVSLTSKELPIVQNSFHTLLFSLYRKNQHISVKEYFSNSYCDSIMPIRKQAITNTEISKKNIVLFIMESVPYDFFDSSSIYKVKMQFFDSIIKKSSYYNNAFSYAFESNKGIVSILAGTPTLTDIPLYHSSNTNMNITKIGELIEQNGYNSFFCIGDSYDNFGFAKCTNWLGINKYYCKNDMNEYSKKPLQTMGMQDEDVLNFFENKIYKTKEPFLAINYNISTHYPYDIPKDFGISLPKNYTAAMKAMNYYDSCLNIFFKNAQKKAWFKNTIFIFCSDHWMYPDMYNYKLNYKSSLHIPIIIYDPTKNKNITISKPSTQFDIVGTILSITGNEKEYVSFGNNLLDSNHYTKTVFTKTTNNIFQVIDSNYILGYNNIKEKVEYLYEFNIDKNLKTNLANQNSTIKIQNELTKKLKVFLQKASMQYNNLPFK